MAEAERTEALGEMRGEAPMATEAEDALSHGHGDTARDAGAEDHAFVPAAARVIGA